MKIVMKNLQKTLIVILCLFFSYGLNAQNGFLSDSIIPYQPYGSPLFGKDIIINDQPQQNQQAVAICSAFNGWLYASYSYNNINGQTSSSIFKSVDNGITWTQIFDASVGMNGITIPKITLMACGTNVADIKIFLGVLFYDTIYHQGGAAVDRINGNTGLLEAEILQDNDGVTKDFALSSDNLFPAVNSNPYSIAVILSKSGLLDSLIVETSSNGGISFDNRYLLKSELLNSSTFFNKVSLSYGYSPSKNTGRYFAAWEEQDKNNNKNLGHIYAAHSEPNFNSVFTRPVCIDSFDLSGINKMRKPVIACQFSGSDNDSSNFTEVIMAEKQSSSNNYDTRGFYNLQAATSNHFNEFTLSSSSNNKTQADINFNPYNATFVLTYFDSTLRSLPFLTNDVNLANPDNWNVITTAYNDNNNLISPNPLVKLNYLQQSGMNAWISEGNNGNGIALFDAHYSTYTGFDSLYQISNNILLKIFPNPCSSYIIVEFELPRTENVRLNIYNSLGGLTTKLINQSFCSGKHTLRLNVLNLTQNCYLYKFECDSNSLCGKLIVHP
jgi:hypothetical protein